MRSSSLTNLLTQLHTDYPAINFVAGDRFQFCPPDTIFYAKTTPKTPKTDPEQQKYTPLLLLHELGHALIDRHHYQSDIELLQIETLAWQKARELCLKYDIDYNEDFAEGKLDSYRNWLHLNSLCPRCQVNGFQQKDLRYHCPLCGHTWHRKRLAN